MSDFSEVIHRTPTPQPWAEGDNIPWHEPGFSRRMLAEHLSQEHDMASRRTEKIRAHVEWIHSRLLKDKPGRVLDLGCGPGFYANALQAKGHDVFGIDYSPASIEYARQNGSARFCHEDIRTAEYGAGYDLAMLIYGEFNVFKPADASLLLKKMFDAVRPGGNILLEPHSFDFIKKMGTDGTSWWSVPGEGVFNELPHVVLEEHIWDADAAAYTARFFVFPEGGQPLRFAQSMQAYTNEEYCRVIEAAGFTDVTFYPSLGVDTGGQELLFALSARRP